MAKFVNQRDITLIVGVTTSGKTFWTNRHLVSKYDRCVIVSPVEHVRNEYNGYLCRDLEELAERIDLADSERKKFRLKISDISQFETLCQLLYLRGQETGIPTTLCIEEAQRVIPSKKELPDSFKDILFRGGDAYLNLVVVCQRAGSVSLDFRSQWLRIVSFRQSAPADVNWIYQSTGYEEVLGLPNFRPREYLDISPASIKHHLPE